MSELLDKQVNVQKESLKNLPGFARAPASPHAMKMKERKKQLLHQKIFCGKKDL